MSVAYERLIRRLEELEIKYQPHPDRQLVMAGFRGEEGHYTLVAAIDTDDDLFQIFAQFPVAIPEGSRPAIAEAITRANYGLKIGKFEMDMEDGDIRFHACHVMLAGVLEEAILDRFIALALAMMDRYGPAFLSVIYGNETPADAIRVAEADIT